MRTEMYFTRLYGQVLDKNIDPTTLARAMEATIKTVTKINPQGALAMQLMKNKLLKQAVGESLGIGTRKRKAKQAAGTKNEVTVVKKKQKKIAGPAPKKAQLPKLVPPSMDDQ